MVEIKELDFETAFKYPFRRPMGLLNILWILVPIFGWFAICGYILRIAQEFMDGKFKELPKFKFGDNLSFGFMMFIRFIPLAIANSAVVGLSTWLLGNAIGSVISFAISLLIMPILSLNLIKKEQFMAGFEFDKLKIVFNNFSNYIIALLKSLGLGIVFALMSIVLVGIPAGAFTSYIFLADFYKNHIK